MTRILLQLVLATLAGLAVGTSQAKAQNIQHTREYTHERPMVYEDAWNLWPYCYLNERGEPEGYNVDLVRALCQQAGIPYIIRLKPTQQAVEDLREGRSDLMLGLDNRHLEAGLNSSTTVVQLFTHSVVHVKGHEDYVRTTDDLGRQRVVVHEGSFCHYLMDSLGWGANAIPEGDMKAAIKNLSTEGKGQIVWNTMSLKWLMRKYQTANLELTPVDMPHGAYRFLSADTVLLTRLDAAYEQLSMDGDRMERMHNRWFYPELQESGIPSWVWLVAAGVGCVALVLLLFNLNYRYRERKMSSIIQQNTDRLDHIMRMSNMVLWTYEVATRTFHWNNVLQHTEHKLTPLEASKLCSPTDFERLCDAMRRVAAMECEQATLEMKSTTPFSSDPTVHDFSIVISVLRREGGKPSLLLGTMNNVTAERQRQSKAKTLLSRYRSIFDNAMVDMVFYDSEGYIVNMNHRAERTFGMTTEQARALKANLKTVITDDGFDLQTFTHFHVTRTLDVYNQFLPGQAPAPTKIHYELQLVPVRDEQQRLLGIYGTGIEVTGFVNLWQQLKENIRRLKEANGEMDAYIRNIDYVMKMGGVRVATYLPQTHMVTIYRELGVVQNTLTQSRCLMIMADKSKKRALKLFDAMDSLTQQSLSAELLTNLRSNGHAMHMQADFVPLCDASGQVKEYFGLCRDVTDLKVTERQLEKESVRAKEIEELKNSFLRNMSYEIRTPLNAVVGFAELFDMEHQQDDETLFIKEIKDNAAHLLHLINDILFLSRLDAHMIEINPQPIDISKTFEAHCHNGWAMERREGVRYAVLNHFEELVVEIDDTNVSIIVAQLAANAAQHTTSGQVRGRFDYFDGKLMIAIEDTGCGISEEALKHVFERFNSGGGGGTGLGLPICRELAQQMGGQIDISSKEGEGTTVWVVIPCRLVSLERKLDSYTTT